MSNQYTNQILKVVVAQICQTIGWHSIQSTPLELMVDILNRYLEDITKQTYRYSELYNRTEANLDDVGLAYKDMNINLSDIAEYIQYVDPVPCAVEVPKYPLKKESHMNFLKPGSKEVVTRPVHIHEYLPPINPPSDDEDSNLDKNDKNDGALDVVNISGEETPFFKRPCNVSNLDKPDIKKQKVTFEEESRPIREISSVMMTTSGFISPARDGKLPDSKPPILYIPEERKPSIPQPIPSVTPALPVSSLDGNKFSDKKIKKNKNLPEKEKKKEKIPKESLKTKKMEKLEKLGKLSHSIKSEMPNSNGGFASMNSFVDRIKSEPLKPMIHSTLPPPTLPLNAGANILSEKPNNLINAIAPVPKKLGRPRKDKSAEFLGNPNKKPPKINNFLKPNPDILAPFFKPMSDFSALPKARIDPPFMMGNLPLMSSSGINSSFQIGGPSSFPIPPPSIALDEKIPSEPDKQKLNIFKKISKVKDEFSSSSKIELPIVKTEPKTSNMDHVIVIDDDQNSNPLPPTPSTPNISGFKKDSDINDILMKSELPINMTLPRSLSIASSVHHTDDFKFGIEPNRTSTPNKIPMIDGNPPQKIRKKYKTKDKANKKFDFFSEELLKADMYSQLKSSNKLMEEMANQHAASRNATLAAAAVAQQNNMMFPFPFASGPGLIPQPGLFPAFNLNRPPPFGLMHGQNFPGGLNPPLPDINNMFKMYRKPNDMDTPSKPIQINKTHCNVAPLVPESLKLEIPMNSSYIPSTNTSSSNKSKPSGSSSKLFDDMFASNQLSSKKIKLEPSGEPFTSISLSSPMGSPTIPSSSHANPFISDKMNDFSKEIIEIDDNCSVSSKDKKEDKKHKRDKKEKDGKIKKKKDKKEKLKNKEKSDKKKEKEDKKEFKEKLKKERKEKRKEKERAMQSTFNHDMESISSNDNFDLTSSVPRLTLKLERNSSPVTPDNKKTTIKSIKKEDFGSDDYGFGAGSTTIKRERDPSPELVRISPLVTRPPKPTKPITMKKKDDGDNKANNSHDNINSSQITSPHGVNAIPTPGRGRPKGSTKLVNAAKNLANATKMNKMNPGNGIKSPKQHQQTTLANLATTITAMPPSAVVLIPPAQPTVSTSSVSATTTSANIQISGGSNNNNSSSINTLNNNNNNNNNVSNNNNNNSNIGNSNNNNNTGTQISTSSLSSSSSTLPTGIRDSDGNQVWICPACGRVDDGTPMIGCDGCDAWYHWVCVGIQVPPDANEDWYCRVCIVKKQESQGGEKKKKRKKKDKKDH